MNDNATMESPKFCFRNALNVLTLIGLLFFVIGIVLAVVIPPNLRQAEHVTDSTVYEAQLVSVESFTERVPEERIGREGSEYTHWVTKTKYHATYEYTHNGVRCTTGYTYGTPNVPETHTVHLYLDENGWSEQQPVTQDERILLYIVFAVPTLIGAVFAAIGISLGMPPKPKRTPKRRSTE